MIEDNVRLHKHFINGQEPTKAQAFRHEALLMTKAGWRALVPLCGLCITLASGTLGYAAMCQAVGVQGGASRVIHLAIAASTSEPALAIASCAYTVLIAAAYFRIKVSGEDS